MALDRYQGVTGDTRPYRIAPMRASSAADRPRLFRLSAPDRELVMKLDPRDPPSDRLRREFDQLTGLAPVFADLPDCAILAPVYLDDGGGCLVTEYVPGQTVYALVQEARTTAELADIARHAGRWLAVLHGSSAPVMASYEPDWAIRRLFELAEAKGGDAPAIDIMRCADLIFELSNRLQLVRHLPCPRVPSHGDFTGGNLILSEGRITGLDTATGNPKLSVYDIVDLLTNLDLGGPDHGLWSDEGRADGPLLHGFLEGYGTGLAPAVLEAALLSRLAIVGFRITRREWYLHGHRRRRLRKILVRLGRIFPE